MLPPPTPSLASPSRRVTVPSPLPRSVSGTSHRRVSSVGTMVLRACISPLCAWNLAHRRGVEYRCDPTAVNTACDNGACVATDVLVPTVGVCQYVPSLFVVDVPGLTQILPGDSLATSVARQTTSASVTSTVPIPLATSRRVPVEAWDHTARWVSLSLTISSSLTDACSLGSRSLARPSRLRCDLRLGLLQLADRPVRRQGGTRR